jgi:hypothetical protein
MLTNRTGVMRLTSGRLLLLLFSTAVSISIAFAANPLTGDDKSNAGRKAADATKRGDPLAAANAWMAAHRQRCEKRTGIPLPMLFLIMGSVEGQKELKLSEDQKVKARYALLSKRLPRGTDPREYQTDEYQKKEDEAAKALIDTLSPEQIARLILMETGLQTKALRALATPDVVSALGITNEQRTELRNLESKLTEELHALAHDLSLPQKERQGKPAVSSNTSRQLAKRWKEAAMAILTPQQREKFQTMWAAYSGWSFHSVPQNVGGGGRSTLP